MKDTIIIHIFENKIFEIITTNSSKKWYTYIKSPPELQKIVLVVEVYMGTKPASKKKKPTKITAKTLLDLKPEEVIRPQPQGYG